MTIPVTTRGGKGAPLTQSEMDTNLTNLARDSSTTQQGNTRYATPAEIDAGIVNNAAVTPDVLAGLLNLADKSIGANGYIKLQNGLIIQWGTGAGFTLGAGTVDSGFTYPIAFPTAVFVTVPTFIAVNSGDLSLSVLSQTTSGFTLRSNNAGSSQSVGGHYWIAIGN